MQQIDVEMIGPQSLQAARAGRDGCATTRVVGVDLADQEDPVALGSDGIGDDFLGTALAVHFCGVDERQPDRQAQPQARRPRARVPFVAHPSATYPARAQA